MSKKDPKPAPKPEPAAYQWDFDRNPELVNPDWLTFSIGIFQWLPKASGRGLKKSTTIRVKGYAVDPETAYEKAAELCRRLNRERVRIDQRPAWLQKQYSVPLPADMVINDGRDRLSRAQVRATRIQVMKRLLLPAAFIHATAGAYTRQAETYVRRAGDQIHLINFQPSSGGYKYTVNLGFHYAFAIGFSQRKQLTPAEYHELDCAARARIGAFIPGDRDVWFDYGTDRDALRATFEKNVALCLATFDRFGEKWCQPESWLANISATGNFRRPFVRPWDVGLPLPFAACIAKELGRNDECRRLLKWTVDSAPTDDREFYTTMARDIQEL